MAGDGADSDFVLACKMFNSARAIVEKNPDNTMEGKSKSLL